MNNLTNLVHKVNVHSIQRPVLSNVLAGIGLYHAINIKDSYLEAGISLICPSIYFGYNLYKGSFDNEIKKIINTVK